MGSIFSACVCSSTMMLCRLFSFAGFVLVLGNVNIVSSRTQLTVELGICVDRNILKDYEKKYGRSWAEQKLRSDVLSTVNKASELTSKLGISNLGGIKLRIANLAILKSGRAADQIAYYAQRDDHCRDELRKYSQKRADVVLTFTHSFSGHTGGWAHREGVCLSRYNVILMSLTGQMTPVMLAHEVGHTLGSTHYNDNGCSHNYGSIMASKVNNHHDYWSKCSKERISKVISNSRGRVVKRCLLTRGRTEEDGVRKETVSVFLVYGFCVRS